MARRLAFLSQCLVVIAASFGIARLAAAHPAPFSYLDVYLEPEGLRGALVIHDFDAAHELGIEKPESLLNAAVAREHRAALIRVIEARLRLQTSDATLQPRWGDIETLTERQSVLLPFSIDTPVRGRLDIDARLFPYDPNHQTFINIYEGGALRQQAILDSSAPAMQFYSGSLQGRWLLVSTFVRAGVHHILIGPDHVLFLLGLLLLGGSLWRLAAIVTAFTIGHSVTLSLAALNIVQLSPRLVEPAIALSIIVVGVDNLLVSRQRKTASGFPHPAPLPSGEGTQLSGAGADRDLRTWMAGIFGLIHGFGFAAVLMEIGLPTEALGWSLAAFNIGVEIGQLFIVMTLLALARLTTMLPAYRTAYAERFLTLASMGVIAAGVYWLAQRIGLTPAT
jgi:hydrogenase/urease accessory protein HupE